MLAGVGTGGGCGFFSNDFISIRFQCVKFSHLASANFGLKLCRHVALVFSCSVPMLRLNELD